jgi:hypothetical protein
MIHFKAFVRRIRAVVQSLSYLASFPMAVMARTRKALRCRQ